MTGTPAPSMRIATVTGNLPMCLDFLTTWNCYLDSAMFQLLRNLQKPVFLVDMFPWSNQAQKVREPKPLSKQSKLRKSLVYYTLFSSLPFSYQQTGDFTMFPPRKHIHWRSFHKPVPSLPQVLHIPGKGRRIAGHIHDTVWACGYNCIQ